MWVGLWLVVLWFKLVMFKVMDYCGPELFSVADDDAVSMFLCFLGECRGVCTAEYNGFVVVSVVVGDGVGGVGGCGFEMDVDGIAVFSVVNIVWLFFYNSGVLGWCDSGKLSGIDRGY